MKIFWFTFAFICGTALVSCGFDPAAFSDAVATGTGQLAPIGPQIPSAVAGNPTSIAAIVSYTLNAALAAWGTYERKKRKKAEKKD